MEKSQYAVIQSPLVSRVGCNGDDNSFIRSSSPLSPLMPSTELVARYQKEEATPASSIHACQTRQCDALYSVSTWGCVVDEVNGSGAGVMTTTIAPLATRTIVQQQDRPSNRCRGYRK